jgi:hypothetical protein
MLRVDKFLDEDVIQLCLSVAIHVHLEDFMLNGRQVWIYRIILIIRKIMDADEHERPSNITPRHKLI